MRVSDVPIAFSDPDPFLFTEVLPRGSAGRDLLR